jgi:protein-S-isoprenylcysteine O-methyltransferase Ste14
MAFPTLWNESNTLWLVFAIYFVIKFRPVQVKRDGGFSYLSFERIAFFLGGLFVFFPRTHLFFLAAPFHKSHALGVAGLCLTTTGLAFACWARDVLGRYWSGRVIVQQHHQLITVGPYAYVRHPLYTGLLIAMAGTTLIAADFGSAIGFFFFVGFFAMKAQREEKILETEFGPAYTNYRAHTGGLLPRIAHV